MSDLSSNQKFRAAEPILNTMLAVRSVAGGSEWIKLHTFGGYLNVENARLLRDWLNNTLPADEPETGHWYAGEDIDRLVRELDVWLNGEAGAAKQAKLCDIVAQVSRRTPPTSALRDVVRAVVDWNTKYPSSRIYGEASIRRIAAEMDVIFEQAKAALSTPDVEAGPFRAGQSAAEACPAEKSSFDSAVAESIRRERQV